MYKNSDVLYDCICKFAIRVTPDQNKTSGFAKLNVREKIWLKNLIKNYGECIREETKKEIASDLGLTVNELNGLILATKAVENDS